MDVEDEELEGGGCGTWVLAALAVGVITVLYRISAEAFVLILWSTGWGAIIYAAKKRPHTPNPAPPPDSERGSDEEPQVSFIRDTSHPNRLVAIRQSKWLRWTDEKTGTSS